MADADLSKLKIDKPVPGARSKRRKKWTWPAVAALAALVLAALYAGGFLRRPTPVKLAAISRAYPAQSLSQLSASGYVVAQRKAAVASKITGRLVELLVREGDSVKADQIVARLENADALAARDQARANLAIARARVQEAEAELANAKVTFERNRRLSKIGAVSQSQYDMVESRYQATEAAVSSARAAVTLAEASLRGAEVALEYTLIRAPFDAVVLTKDADVGDIVTPIGAATNAKAAVITIADMGSLKVEVDVSETSLSQVKLGQACEIQLDALPEDRFRGAVDAIVPTADRTKASVQVKIRFLDQDARILPEMSAKVAFLSRPVTAEEQDSYTALPRSAILAGRNEPAVFVERQGIARLTPVRLGKEYGDLVEVLEGLEAGDKVVIEPPARLRDGTRIRAAEE